MYQCKGKSERDMETASQFQPLDCLLWVRSWLCWRQWAFYLKSGSDLWTTAGSSSTLLAHHLQLSLAVGTMGTGHTAHGHQPVPLSWYRTAAVLWFQRPVGRRGNRELHHGNVTGENHNRRQHGLGSGGIKEETRTQLATTSFQVHVESNNVTPQPLFLQAKQAQLKNICSAAYWDAWCGVVSVKEAFCPRQNLTTKQTYIYKSL